MGSPWTLDLETWDPLRICVEELTPSAPAFAGEPTAELCSGRTLVNELLTIQVKFK